MSRFIVITVGSHIGAPGRMRGALAPAPGCALWYLLTEPVAGHHCAPSGQRALLLGCQRAWAGARHIRGPADRPGGRVSLRHTRQPAERGGSSQTQRGERHAQALHHGVPFLPMDGDATPARRQPGRIFGRPPHRSAWGGRRARLPHRHRTDVAEPAMGPGLRRVQDCAAPIATRWVGPQRFLTCSPVDAASCSGVGPGRS